MIGKFNFDYDKLDSIGQIYVTSDSADKDIAYTVEGLLDRLYRIYEISPEELKAVSKALNKPTFKRIPKVETRDAVEDTQLLSFLHGILYAEWVRTKFCDYEYFLIEDREYLVEKLWEGEEV